MASITGGKTLVFVVGIIISLVVLSLFVSWRALSLDNLLSMSLSLTDILNQEQEQVIDSQAEEAGEVTLADEPSPQYARDLLGFVEYPVVEVENNERSLFSPIEEDDIMRLSEAEIAQRCSHISISFNRNYCVKAERACAAVVDSNAAHWSCLQSKGFYGGKKL